MKLKADRVSGGGTARQPPPLDRALAFFDALLCRRSNSTTSIRGCRASDPSDSCLRPPPWRLRARSPEPRRSRYWSVSEPVAGLRGELAQRLRAHIPELAGPSDPRSSAAAKRESRWRPAEGTEHHHRRSRREPIPAAARPDARLEWSAGPERGNLGSYEWGNKAHNASSLALVRCFTIEGRRQQSLAQSQLRFRVLI
jgi:hypothetical protein